MKRGYSISYRIFLIIFILFPALLRAQGERPYEEPSGLNNWFIEFGGAGLFYSLNYDKILYRSTRWGWDGRIGVGYNPADYRLLNKVSLNGGTVMTPFTTSVTYGERKEKLEFGGGFTLLNEGISNRSVAYTAIIGFRVVEANKVFFRIAYTPILQNGNYINWYGVSLGRNFSTGKN